MNWESSIEDTDKGAWLFYAACSAAGPAKCPLYEPTAEAIHARVNRLLDTLKNHPIYARSVSDPSNYGFIDYSRMKLAIFEALYKPYSNMPPLAVAIAALERGDGSLMLDISGPDHVSCPSCGGGSPSKPDLFGFTKDESRQLSIMCGDAAMVQDTLEDARKTYEKMSKQSEFADT